MPPRVLQPVRRSDLTVGAPLPYPIYDANWRLLLRAGEIIETEHQLDLLCGKGLYVDRSGDKVSPATGGTSFRHAGHVQHAGQGHSATHGQHATHGHHVAHGHHVTHGHPAGHAHRAEAVSASLPNQRSFVQLRLVPGKLLTLNFLSETKRPQVSLKLIGYLEHQGILLSALDAEGAVVPFREGELLFVRVVAENDVVTFDSSVSKVKFSPFPYLMLTYPEKVLVQTLRRHARIATRLIVTVANLSHGGGGEPVAGLVTNLSSSGARLEAPPALAGIGDHLRVGLKLQTAGAEHVLTLEAEVRGLGEAAGRVGMARFGLQFLHLSTPERVVIEHFIFQELLGI